MRLKGWPTQQTWARAMSVIVIYNDSDNGNNGDNYKRA
jgi:hypothetical protein